jgi:hypothetical protein
MLVQKYLKSRGLNAHRMRISISPKARGSAENWVQMKFVEETKAYRMRQPRARTELLVVIDADTSTVQRRFNQLDRALRTDGNEIVSDGERIARLVSKRNVETWILCLNQENVDENNDYKTRKRNWSKIISAAGNTLNQWSRMEAGPPPHCISSLRTGVLELKRLTQ